jgi:hypothetical protein
MTSTASIESESGGQSSGLELEPGTWDSQDGGVAIDERRQHRRHDLAERDVAVERWDGNRSAKLGILVDLSSGGMKIRTNDPNIQPDQHIRLKLRLPAYAGISPFVDTTGERILPKNEWTGWMSVARVQPTTDGDYEVGGELMDMQALDRGMLGLYLSMHPVA